MASGIREVEEGVTTSLVATATLGFLSMKQARVSSDLMELESGHTFRMWSVHDIFRKLGREKSRLEKAVSDGSDRADQVDAAINFAITAWHMTEWVWGQHQCKLKKNFGISKLSDFQDKLRRQCSDLAVCDVIANAAKHGGSAHKMGSRPDVRTILIAHPFADDAAGVELMAVQADRKWSLEIKVNGTTRDAIELFSGVFFFWHKFIQKHCVAK